MSWLPSDPLNSTLNGAQSYDLWLNLASVANMSRTTPFTFNGTTYELPYSIPGNAGGGMFPGMTMWAPYKSQFGTSTTQGDLIKTANGTGGGPYPAGSSIYYGGASPVANTNGGSLAVKGYAVPNVKTVTFQLSIGEAYGYSLWDADGNGLGPEDMPKLKVYGPEGQLLDTLTATHSDIVKKAYNGSMQMPPGSGLDEDIYINTFGFQWNLSGIEGTIASFQADWTGVQHAQLWSLRLDQTDSSYNNFVFDLTSNWTGAGDGVWSSAGNWQGGTIPSTVGKAIVGTAGSISLSSDTSIGQLLIQSPGDLNISSASDAKLTPSLNVSTQANGGPANHIISTRLGLPSVVTLDVGQDTVLNLTNSVTGVGFYKRGSGALNLSGSNDFSGSLIFGGGTTTVSGTNLTSQGSLLDLKNSRLILQGNDRFEAEFKAKLSGTSILGQSAYIQLGDSTTGAVTQTFADLSAAKPQYVKELNPNPELNPPVYVVGGSSATSTLTLKGGLYAGNLGGPGEHENNFSVVVTGSPTLQGTSTYTGDTVIKTGGVLRADRDAALSVNGNLVIEGGTLALGSFSYMTPGGTNDDGILVTESMSSFTRPLGSGPGQVRYVGGGAIKAVGADRTVNFGGAGAQVTWGQGGFVADGGELVLQSENTTKLTLANAIDLGSSSRVIRVDASNHAELSGSLSGTAGFTKVGFGSLTLSGISDYTGPTRIAGGLLRFPELGNAGGPSFLGDSTNAAENIILSGGLPEAVGGGQLTYTGTGDASTDRLFTISGTVGSVANDGTTGSIQFTNTGAIAFASAEPAILELRGTNNNPLNIFNPLISDNGEFKTSLRKGGQYGVGGTGGYWKIGREDNTYTGQTIIASGTLEITKITDGGIASSIGASSNAASNLPMFQGGIKYTGTGDSTDRLFGISIGATSPSFKTSFLDSSGTGPLVFTNPGSLIYAEVDGQTRDIGTGGWLGLSGTNTGDNSLAAKIDGWVAGNARVFKEGTGRWILKNTNNTYAGITEIRGGTLAAMSLKDSGPAVVMSTTANSVTATVTSSAGLVVGHLIQGPGLPIGTTIAAVNGNTVTLSQAATNTYTSGNNRNKVVGLASSIGASTNLATSLLIDNGALQYLGTGDSTDRRFTVGINGAGLDASGPGTITFSNSAAVTYSGTTSRTLSLRGTNTGNNTLAAAIGNAGTGVVSVTKSGPGTWVLSGANSYTGSTTVSEGKLSLSSGVLADSSAVIVAEGATLDLNFPSTVVDLVASLTLGGEVASSGVWGAEGSGAPKTSPYLTGTGRIRVAGPFDAWAAQITNAANRDRTLDADGDGFSNLHEFLFGSSPVTLSKALVESARSEGGLVLRWNELVEGGTYQLQESTSLAADSWVPSELVPATAADQSAAPEDYIRKEVTVPIGSEHKFIRVNGTEN